MATNIAKHAATLPLLGCTLDNSTVLRSHTLRDSCSARRKHRTRWSCYHAQQCRGYPAHTLSEQSPVLTTGLCNSAEHSHPLAVHVGITRLFLFLAMHPRHRLKYVCSHYLSLFAHLSPGQFLSGLHVLQTPPICL